jgi:hypothetical protein
VYSYLASQAAKDRQREMLAQASQQRLGQQARALARASRRAERAQRRVRGAVRRVLRLRRTRAMTPLPAGHARPHRVPDQAHPGSSPAPRERAPPPDHGGGAPCRAERLRRPMVRRRSAGSGRRLTIRRRQHTPTQHTGPSTRTAGLRGAGSGLIAESYVERGRDAARSTRLTVESVIRSGLPGHLAPVTFRGACKIADFRRANTRLIGMASGPSVLIGCSAQIS